MSGERCSCGRASVGDVEQLPAAEGLPRATLRHGAERCEETATPTPLLTLLHAALPYVESYAQHEIQAADHDYAERLARQIRAAIMEAIR